MDSENLSSLIRLSVSDGQKTVLKLYHLYVYNKNEYWLTAVVFIYQGS